MCRYMGGKGKIGKYIANRILEIEDELQFEADMYFEPMIGMAGVMRHMGERKKMACDRSSDIIHLWRDVQCGWSPPNFLTKDEFIFQKTQPSSALRCFAAHGCSYGGMCFNTYIGNYNGGKGDIDRSSRSITRVGKLISDVQFVNSMSYTDHSPTNSTIYCDPPYITACKGVLNMDNFNSFDHTQFWSTMRKWVNDGNLVIVSEFTAPEDFKSVWHRKTVLNVKHDKGHRIEKLFMHESQSVL